MHATIVSAEELAKHLHDPHWAIVDCRHSLQDYEAGRRLYGAGHIPGAFFADVETDLSGSKTGSNGRHPLPEAADFAKLMRDFGVGPTTQLVAYDAGGDMFAARFWFLARYFGHDAVAVLDGGYAAWTAAKLPVERAQPQPRAGTFEANAKLHLAVDADTVLGSLDDKSFALIDARGTDRFHGENETIDPVGGHIPGALNRPFRANFDESGRLKSPERLREEFEAIGIDPERIVHQCGSGVSAAVNMLAMEHAGKSGSRLYPGSWSEWCADRSRPMITRSK